MSSIRPGCSRHLRTIFSSGMGSTPGFGRHHHQVVVGDDEARRSEPVAVQGGADLAAVGEGDGGRPVPGLHQRGMIFVEGAAPGSMPLLPAQASGISSIIACASE